MGTVSRSNSTANDVKLFYPEIDFGAHAVPDFHQKMAALRDAGHRVVPVKFIGETAWIVLRYDDVAAAYADDNNLPAACAYRRHSMPTQGKTLLAMEGDEHRVNRLLVSKAFHPPSVRRLVEPLLLPLANELVDSLKGKETFDLVEEYSHRFPFSVITRMLGIPVTDHGQLVDWVEGLFNYPWDPEGAIKAKDQFTAYIAPVVSQRRQQPGADLISMLAAAEVEGQRLSDEEIYAFIRLLFPAGADTTYLAIGSMMLSILQDPALKQRLLEKPGDRIWAVEESLRLNGTIGLQPRYTEKAVTIGGVDIPADSVLLYGNATANHDPDKFPDPQRFDLDRRSLNLLTFGKGVHFCLGSHLARAEMQISLNVLLDRLQGLRLVDPDNTNITHAVLRGPRTMQVTFDRLLPATSVNNRLRIGKD